jgi:hypothetical protein
VRHFTPDALERSFGKLREGLPADFFAFAESRSSRPGTRPLRLGLRRPRVPQQWVRWNRSPG